MEFPDEVQVNAWTGTDDDNRSKLGATAFAWGLGEVEFSQKLGAEDPPDYRNWQDPRVGWGLVLPENLNIPASERGLAEDAPEPIRRLWESRGKAPVFRYQDGASSDDKRLRRYTSNGAEKDPAIGQSEVGIANHQIPRYLLICASPSEIPWSFQYHLNLSSFVGRLDLDEQGLENYVSALLTNWENSKVSTNNPVVWSVDHQNGDITTLMQKAIAQPLASKLQNDSQIGDKLLQLLSSNATNQKLVDALVSRNPALIVSTSHGLTPMSGTVEELRSSMGLLVDQDHALLDPSELLNSWKPDGAIWYAHACCGAGTDAVSSYRNLFDSDSRIRLVLDSVAKAGSVTSRFARELLSNDKPLRAFIGHVEPTFDWTIREGDTKQLLTSSILDALYNGFHRSSGPEPVAMAFEKNFDAVATLLDAAGTAREQVQEGQLNLKSVMVRKKVAALDRRSLVILGDPTAALPPLI